MKTIVVKVGSSTVADDHLRLRRRLLAGLVSDIAGLVHGGRRVVLVSSGAIACGQHVLGVQERPRQVPALQAASAVGQGRLFAHYERLFGDYELTAAQVLLTSEDFNRRSSYVNARNTLRRLLSWGVVPVVNENDTTATDEIRFGDNDVLAAHVAIMLRADHLVLLTDQDGLYTADPRTDGSAELVRRVTDPAELAALDVGNASRRGAGGMRGKTAAALMAAAADVRTVIANGSLPGVVSAAVGGKDVGTQVLAHPTNASAFKLWLRYAKPVRGTLEVDAGAARALAQGGSSLLPVGVTAVRGSFLAGDAVAIVGPSGEEVARGLSTMSARDLRRVRGLRSDELRAVSPHLEDEVVHRDCLVLVGEEAG
ncbi:MAG: glutamate 5-kinase [Actinobacteria bacterium]|nr:glutamate 5-kinase [Actinomycetota bacterium]